MADSFDLIVEWITAGAVGQPGQRTFYVQARGASQLVSLLVEKAQVAGLAQLAQRLLARVGVTVMPDDLDTARYQLVEPVIAAWRVGTMSLATDESGEQFILEAQELQPDDDDELPATARFTLTREQLVGLAAHAAYAVEAGAREACRLCGRPIDPVSGHVCPSSNGHGPLTR